MKIFQLFLFFLLISAAILMGCGPNEEEIANQVSESVELTVEAIPTTTPYTTQTAQPSATPYPTLTPLPSATPYPTSTSFPTPDLANLFCEYGFCIGHPADAYLVDVDAPEDWSTFSEGSVFGIEGDTVIGVFWETKTEEAWDIESEVLDLIDEDEEIQGELVQETIGNIFVAYAIFHSQDPSVNRPYRLGASWHCGNRGFVLIFLSNRDDVVFDFMQSSLEKFSCIQ